MVPPIWPPPETMSRWESMVVTTGSGVWGSISVEEASVRPRRLRAISMTMHCRPRHSPRVGTRFSRAQRSAPSLPSMPRTPKPPGTTTASTPARARSAPSGLWQASEATQRSSARA
ncbi:hypothetical protein ACSL103130_10615 [Actinomyces slackii]